MKRANITFNYFQANDEDKYHLEIKIQTAIAALNEPLSPMSI